MCATVHGGLAWWIASARSIIHSMPGIVVKAGDCNLLGPGRDRYEYAVRPMLVESSNPAL
jgi:hypothetical protein